MKAVLDQAHRFHKAGKKPL
jgi:hypothetical protein